MSTFFQGYLGAVSSAVTIAVSSHVYYTKLYYVIWCVERIVFWILNFELPFYANRDYIHDFSSTVNLILCIMEIQWDIGSWIEGILL